MMKSYFIILTYLTLKSGVISHLQGEREEGRPFKGNEWSSSRNVEIRLTKLNNVQISDGLLLVLLPNSSHHYHVCYPSSNKDSELATKLAQVVCRERGFMTCTSLYKIELSSNQSRRIDTILPTSASCHGFEQSISQCPWNSLGYDDCQTLMGIRCGSCNEKIEAETGTLSNPGSPYAYHYGVSCEWLIVVPDNHDISFTFKAMHLPPASHVSKTCEGTVAYLEIIYGMDDKYSSKKYCRHKSAENFTVPHSKAKVRFFSGLYYGGLNEETERYGFSFDFRAMPASLNPILVNFLIGLAAACATFIFYYTLYLCCMYCKPCTNIIFPEPPSLDQLDRSFSPTSHFKLCRNVRPRRDTGDVMQNYSLEGISRSVITPNNLTDSKRYCQVRCQTHVIDRKRGTSREGSTATPRTTAPRLDKNNYRTSGSSSRYSYLAKFKTKLLTRFSVRSNIHSSRSSTTPDRNCNSNRPLELGFSIYHSTTSSTRSTKSKNSMIGISISTPKVETSETGKDFRSIPEIVIDCYDDDDVFLNETLIGDIK